MAFEADWHPVALSEGLEAGTSAPARLLGAEIVIWRDTVGHAHVWQDRCPHRGMRLSFGFVRGDAIACLYHGWRFDTAGRCRFIPAHPQLDVPDTIRVVRYPVREACGMVWAHVAPDGATFPQSAGSLSRPAVVAVRSLFIDRPAAAVLDHLCSSVAAIQPSDAPPLTAFTLDGSRVYAGLQPVDAAASALHLVAEAGADRYAIAIWAVALRRALEAAVAATESEVST